MATPAIPIYQHKKSWPMPDGDQRLPFVIVGSGPVGLTLALDLARKGHKVVIVTAFNFIALGSKAICFSKQTLDIFDRLGVGEKMVEKGVIWNVGKLFWQDQKDPVYQFDMLPVKDQKNPGFINLQQYYVEEYLVDALEAMDNVEIRWGHTVSDINISAEDATLLIQTREGSYDITADYVLACDGSKSSIRDKMGLDFQGRIFEDNFLIADVKFKQERPSERWFWFDPPFCKGGTALLHKQPDDIWRLDFQLGWEIDREAAILPENVEPFVKGLIGEDTEFDKEWYSVYTFQCRRMERFVHGSVIFVGDSAHLVSPFGARGANGGFSDAENLAWKLDMVLRQDADATLLETYNYERVMGADENILNSSRATDFMTPKDNQSQAFRDAVLGLARDYEFARPFINSGRLSTPTPYHNSPLSTEDTDTWDHGIQAGYPSLDAPLEEGVVGDWLLEKLGDRFILLHFGKNPPSASIETITLPATGLAAERYGAEDGTSYLIRPDQVVAARWKQASSGDVERAHRKATGCFL
jgi:3-(3-hydroxy-phenyl)propionate hydroxylase